MYPIRFFNKARVARIVIALIVLSLLSTMPYIISEGLKRHGEDVGRVPLAIPVDELMIVSNNSLRVLSYVNNSSSSYVVRISQLLKLLNKGSSSTVIISVSNKLFEYLNNTSIPWMSRFDYMGLALLASIEDVYDKVAIIDPVRLITLLKSYEEGRRNWLIGMLEKTNPILAEYIKEYNSVNNTTIRELLLNRIRGRIQRLIDKGRIDIVLLVAEALNTSTPLGFTIDRIKLAEYLNNTSKLLEKHHIPEITGIISLMRTISSELYRGEIGLAWQHFTLLKNKVLRLNVTLDFKDAVKLSLLLSINGLTINGAYLSISSLKTTSSVVADILSTQNYDIRLKVAKILAGIPAGKRIGREVNVGSGSLRVLSMILAVNESKINLSMIALRQPLTSVQEGRVSPVISVVNPILFIVVLALSSIIAGVILYSTIQSPLPTTQASSREEVFSEFPLRKDKYARVIVEYYVRALKLLSSKGYPRRYWETPREHLERLNGTTCYEPFSVLVEFYERTIFANERVVAREEALDKLLEEIEKCR